MKADRDKAISIPLRYDCEELHATVQKAITEFQFHLGTIVSIWSMNTYAWYLISIPLRYDCEFKRFVLLYVCKRISIPLRYDCEPSYLISQLQVFKFQFHLGTIVRLINKLIF